MTENLMSDALVVQGSDCNLSIDPKRGEIVFERRPLLGRTHRRVFRLGSLEDLRLRVSDRPALDVGIALKLLSAAVQTVREGQEMDTAQHLDDSPRQLSLRIRARNNDGALESVEERLRVDGIVNVASADELVQKMSAAAGLTSVERYALPGCGVEFHLEGGKGDAGSSITELPEDIGQLPRAPFDVNEFDGDRRIEDWSPGTTVRLHQPLSMLAPFLVLLALPCFAGAALALNEVVAGDPSSRTQFLIIAAFGLVCGGALAFLIWLLLPETVVLDWGAREARTHTWFSKQVVPFAEIARLELEAKRVSVGGDNSHTKFAAALRLIRRNHAEDHPDAVHIAETTTLRHIDDPLWMAMPLFYELASALNVEAKFENYPSKDG